LEQKSGVSVAGFWVDVKMRTIAKLAPAGEGEQEKGVGGRACSPSAPAVPQQFRVGLRSRPSSHRGFEPESGE
jgi:hypothetical protein